VLDQQAGVLWSVAIASAVAQHPPAQAFLALLAVKVLRLVKAFASPKTAVTRQPGAPARPAGAACADNPGIRMANTETATINPCFLMRTSLLADDLLGKE
jgi:hypothetical protein